MKFSVLISIYHNEKAKYFRRAMKSIWDEQSIKPNEIILVLDGMLTDELYTSIDTYKSKINVLKVVPLEQNMGLGIALNEGLEYCTYELIARMDTDDISHPDRFEKQLNIFRTQNIDICGSWVSEFETNENSISSIRQVPQKSSDIIKLAQRRNPMNHPSVMYKKSQIDKINGYQDMKFFEDYYLWICLILNDAKFYNIQEALVNMKAGYAQLGRRKGFNYLKNEINFQTHILKLGFISYPRYIKNILTRATARILPKTILKQVYKRLRSYK